MVVGNGLIGKAFSSYLENDEVCIFASGVSNSQNKDNLQFEREYNLVKTHLSFNGLFVYFSTTSIEDPELKSSKYIDHKLKIENLIKTHAKSFFIIRLPNVVGESNNKHTLINFFNNSILNNYSFYVQKNARRYLIHIDKLYQVVNDTLKHNKSPNKIANLIIKESVSVVDIVKSIEQELKIKGNYVLIEGGSNYKIKVDPIFIPHI